MIAAWMELQEEEIREIGTTFPGHPPRAETTLSHAGIDSLKINRGDVGDI